MPRKLLCSSASTACLDVGVPRRTAADLVAIFDGMQGVRGSSPLSSTPIVAGQASELRLLDDLAADLRCMRGAIQSRSAPDVGGFGSGNCKR
jgi:hypothetical protein